MRLRTHRLTISICGAGHSGSTLLGLVLGWLGVGEVVLGLLLGFLYGAAVGLVLLATGVRSRRDHIPFGPFLAGGALTALLVGEAILDWYSG